MTTQQQVCEYAQQYYGVPAADAVTRHVREFSARCETPDIGEVV